MLCANSYPREYINGCRAAIAKQVGAFQALQRAGTQDAKIRSTMAAFEPLFFNGLVLLLEGYFVHRSRSLEKKDGNPLNEVRMLAASIMNNGAVLATDKSIKYTAASAVLGINIGERIALDRTGFTSLAQAFLREIEARYL